MNHTIHPCSSAGLELTEEQKARTAENLRLAKARLARKGHQSVVKSPEKKKLRVPLADLQLNTLESVSASRTLADAENSFFDGVDESVLNSAVKSPEKKKFRVPLADLQVNTPGRVSTSGKLEHSFFDEFDESELEEIDKLCEKKVVEDSVPSKSVEPLPSYLQKLNKSQRDAALSDINKPLLILAGPGSGKTSTMVARVLTLLHEGVEAKKILAMTFTTAAAKEMMDRVGAVVGKETSKELMVSTFHSFCLQLCRSHAEKLNRTPEFLIYGTSQQRKAVVEATRLASAEKPDETDTLKPGVWKDRAKKWQQFVTQAKASGSDYEEIERKGNTLGAAVLRHYEEILASCNALDYHDFIKFSVKLFIDHPDVLDECHKTWPYILVDEFQDTSVMQYKLLQMLASHKRVTIVGDDDQSIFSFNGANNLGFNTFRRDFPDHKEVRLHQNYRSTGCIVEAAKCVIQNNASRCTSKHVQTDNDFGEKIIVKECRNEESQCAFVVDEILKSATASNGKSQFANFAVLYRRQITGRMFQSTFRSRKIPFNMHGVAFYRKKIVRNVIALLWTALEGCCAGNTFERRVFKALYAAEKTETKKAVEYVERHAGNEKCSFLQAAERIFTAKVSGTFNRRQLAQGKKVLNTVGMVKHLVAKEQSLSSLVSAVLNMLPQRRSFETRAVLDESDGKLLNEDEDSRTVLEYLLDDVSDFLGNHFQAETKQATEQPGCTAILKAFLDHLTIRETENFRARREENRNSVTLTTMHQSKGLEWDTVFIIKVNELEIPLLHEQDGDSASLEEERRLFYVAMTRARKQLYISYIVVSPQRQILQPSRFLSELPRHLLQSEVMYEQASSTVNQKALQDGSSASGPGNREASDNQVLADASAFLRGFNVEARATIASLFHTWAKKPAFQDPKRLLTKVGFVIDERLRSKTVKGKDVLHALKCSLGDDEAMLYADQVVKWEKMPLCERVVLQAERQEHFQQKSSERAMSTAPPTPKQIAFLRSFGCTINPTTRLHASKLIEQYKSL